jgi:hypothetical protein
VANRGDNTPISSRQGGLGGAAMNCRYIHVEFIDGITWSFRYSMALTSTRNKPETGNMKKSTRKTSLHPKLALRSETVASLTPPQLGQVVGGVDGSVLKGCVIGTFVN